MGVLRKANSHSVNICRLIKRRPKRKTSSKLEVLRKRENEYEYFLTDTSAGITLFYKRQYFVDNQNNYLCIYQTAI